MEMYQLPISRKPGGFNRRKGRGGEGMYQLLISRKPLGGFARLTDKISAPCFKETPDKVPPEEQIYRLELSRKP